MNDYSYTLGTKSITKPLVSENSFIAHILVFLFLIELQAFPAEALVPLIRLRELRVNFSVFFPLGFELPADIVFGQSYRDFVLRGIFVTE
jgi:hypothetical protein